MSRQPRPGQRVAVAMSGGVDSSAVAALLNTQGYDVVGITLRLWTASGGEVEGGCCTLDDVYDARAVARKLGIRHYVLDETEPFREAVVQPFIAAYREGRTPSPCILCNNVLKFDHLVRRALQFEAEWLATGHYARIDRSAEHARLMRGADPTRDQSYFLHGIGTEALDRTLFPLGDLPKEEVRELAAEAGLPTASKKDSQDLCFLAGTTLRDFLNAEGMNIKPGPIVDRQGRTLGHHQGAHAFTVGQRKGLGVAHPQPLYVTQVRPTENTLVVGTRDELQSNGLIATDARWFRRPTVNEQVQVRCRNRSTPAQAVVVASDEAGSFTLRFGSPQTAVTPGQAAVLYVGDEVLGGGWIQEAQT